MNPFNILNKDDIEAFTVKIIDKFFPVNEFNFEIRKSIANQIHRALKNNMDSRNYIKRSLNLDTSEIFIVKEFAKLNYHSEIADFLGAARWISHSEIANKAKPATRALIYKKTLSWLNDVKTKLKIKVH